MRNPGGEQRWRRRVLVAAGVVVTGVVSVPIVLAPRAAEAGELASFSSCEELTAWREEAAAQGGGALGEGFAVDQPAMAGDAAAAPESATRAAAGSAGGGTGDTNVAVEGVDELDVVDRIDDRRALVATGGTLALVDLESATRLDTVPVPFDARITFDPATGVVWVVGSGQGPVPGSGQEPVGPGLEPAGSGLHSVQGSEASSSSPSSLGGGVEVTRVAVGGDRLVAEGSWTTRGVLVDARRTGERLHVVAVDSAWMSGGGEVPFGDGPVPCDQVLHPTAPSGGEATLVVSLSARGEVDPQHAAEVIGSGQLVHVTDDAVYLATPIWDGSEPRTGLHRFDAATLAHTGSGAVEGTLLNQYAMSDHEGFLRVALTHPPGFGRGNPEVAGVAEDDVVRGRPGLAGDEEPLNEVVVLDTDGELDVVGRTARFGHPGETLNGIRFVGAVAYAVTFLTTDPFYVVDIGDPAAPAVVGEVELPGFSAYLHPIADGLVVGVGPGADGRATMRLFDVADPARPTVVNTEVLGDDTPVTWDPHAFLGLGGGRLALPATSWTTATTEDCRFPLPGDGGGVGGGPDKAACSSPSQQADTTIVVAGTASGACDVEERISVSTPEPGSRVLAVRDGWALLAGNRLLTVDGAGEVVAEVRLA